MVEAFRSATNNNKKNKLIYKQKVLTVDIWQPRDEQLQLFVGEYGNKLPWNDFIEAVKEGIDLLLGALVQMIVGFSLNIVFLVLVGQVDVSTSWDEVDLLSSSEIIFPGTECLA